MPNKTLSIPDPDLALWEASRRLAKRDGIPHSRFVLNALAMHVPKVAAEPAPAQRWAGVATDHADAAA